MIVFFIISMNNLKKMEKHPVIGIHFASAFCIIISSLVFIISSIMIFIKIKNVYDISDKLKCKLKIWFIIGIIALIFRGTYNLISINYGILK